MRRLKKICSNFFFFPHLKTIILKIGELTTNLENQQQEDTLLHEEENNDIGLSTVVGQSRVVPTLFDDQPTVNNTNSEEPANKIARLGAGESRKLKIIPSLKKGKRSFRNFYFQPKVGIIEEENEENTENRIMLPPATIEKIRNKKRRKLIIDDIKEIDSNTMKTQLSDTRAILGSLELAPPTRKLMLWKETGGVDKLLTLTCRPVHSKTLSKVIEKFSFKKGNLNK